MFILISLMMTEDEMQKCLRMRFMKTGFGSTASQRRVGRKYYDCSRGVDAELLVKVILYSFCR